MTKVTVAKSLIDQVATVVSESNPTVQETVVKQLAQIEIDRRVKALVEALQGRDEAEKKLAKIRPQPVYQLADSDVPMCAFMPAQLADRKKLTEQIERIDNAVTLALGEKQNWEPLLKLSSHGKNDKPSEDAPK